MSCPRTTALVAAATLTLGSLVFAVDQENPMPKQQKVPPMTGQEGGMTTDKPMADKSMAMSGSMQGDMTGGMAADKTINMQLAKYATMPEQAGDMKFALMAGCANAEEIEFSKAVAAKATTPEVKQLATKIQTDHQMALDKLKPIGEKLGVVYPTELPTMQQQNLKFLTTMPPEKMEKAYLSMMKAGHLKVVSDMTDHLAVIKDADLKAWTAETIPHVRAHTADVLKANEMMGMPLDLKFESMPMDHKM